MGYNIYTTIDGAEVRYTEWVKYGANHSPVWGALAARELYNLTADPQESENIAGEDGVQGVVQRLSQHLHAGWRAQLPSTRTQVNISAGSLVWSFALTPRGYSLGLVTMAGEAVEHAWEGGLLVVHRRDTGQREWVFATHAEQISKSTVRFQGNHSLGQACWLDFTVTAQSHSPATTTSAAVAFNVSWQLSSPRCREQMRSLSVPLFGDVSGPGGWRSFMYPWAVRGG